MFEFRSIVAPMSETEKLINRQVLQRVEAAAAAKMNSVNCPGYQPATRPGSGNGCVVRTKTAAARVARAP